MNGGRSDASTSTDDIKGRPLCLFYFTHPFGVLSPEPPTVTAAPPHIARAFLNMEPIEPFHFWTASSTDDSYNTATSDTSRPSYDLGNTTVHKNPVNLVTVKKTRKCTVDFGSRRESISSSLFSSDIWFNSSASSKSNDYTRRMVPYNRILPPLQLPRNMSDLDSSDDQWPRKCLKSEKFSLPPIEMPMMKVELETSTEWKSRRILEEVSSLESVREMRVRRRVGAGAGVRKHRRRRLGDVRRMLTCLMRRAVKGGRSESNPSPALQEVLHTIRDAWAEPTSLFDRTWRTLTRMCDTTARSRDASPRARNGEVRVEDEGKRARQAMLGELPVRLPRPDASPGLLRRRYSVPETVMRKYSMAQQRAECEESGEVSRDSAASLSPVRGACSPCATPRFARDRELMRKSALLRRMWGRAPPSCCCCGEETAPRQARSLDASRSELRSRHATRSPPDAYDEPTPISASTYRSHAWVASSCADTVADALTDPDALRSDERTTSLLVDSSSIAVTAELASHHPQSPPSDVITASQPSVYISPALSLSGSIATDTTSSGEPELRTQVPCDTRQNRRYVGCPVIAEKDSDIHIYDRPPLAADTSSSYEVLEIVVSETLDTSIVPVVELPLALTDESRLRASDRTSRVSPISIKSPSKMNIDEYVSNILVESLNSLTDRLECMTASIGSDKRINIVEKEIKVKLQNTGVNTIVHLSPTSNNQIIFGNEELCDSGDRDVCNNPRDSISIREESHSVESNNNLASAGSTEQPCGTETFGNVIQQDNVNKAVLQQIQKLFQDELHSLDADMNYPGNVMPGISHIEISNVDVYIDDNADPSLGTTNVIKVHTHGNRNTDNDEMMGGVGAGNYYDDGEEGAVVPRLSAFPHTDSMEVNTSSSDDAEHLGSDCTSLVDSLDDPNSPRSILLRRSFNGRRGELVRSAINVLDLLPENTRDDENVHLKDRGESFFIGIKDEDCNCERESMNVADRMPEKIKQRLYRRHRRRQLRMECARRSRVKLLRREKEKHRYDDTLCKTKREIEKDCMAIINALIDDVIAKIAQDEYKCLRIKRKPEKPVLASQKLEENVFKRNRRKDLRQSDEGHHTVIAKHNTSQRQTKEEDHEHESFARQIRGKLSLLTRPAEPINDRGPRRIYQKSEILEGNKCIEILEILEYVNDARSSPETPVSDESASPTTRNGKRSRIPVPVHEKIQRPTDVRNSTNEVQTTLISQNKHVHSREFNASAPPDGLENRRRGSEGDNRECTNSPVARRASLPLVIESRPRSNSFRFRRVFDIIPEERSSLSVESSADDIDRTPLPVTSTPEAPRRNDRIIPHPPPAADTRNAATSPLAEVNPVGGPLRVKGGEAKRGKAWPALARRDEGPGEKVELVDPSRRVGRRTSGEKLDHEKKGKFPTVERKRVTKPEVERKVNRGKPVSDSDKRGTIKHRPPSRYLNDAGKGPGPDDGRGGARAPEPSEEGPSCSTLSPAEDGASSSSGESGRSLLCSLAPKWLSSHTRQRRHRRRDTDASANRQQQNPDDSGGWSVTVAGSCRAALPADVEMRLGFPRCDRDPRCYDDTCACACAAGNCQECSCRQWADCACSARPERACRPARPLPPATYPAPPLAVPAHAAHRLAASDSKLTLTMKKEARDSSLLASKSMRKSSDPLPDLETYRSTRSKTKSSVKTRRGYSLHCWLPEDEPALIRPSNGLSVLGCAIIPELKPRAPTMSERDLTRLYTPRHYLRS